LEFDMEFLLSRITKERLNDVLTGVPLDFSKFPPECYDDLMVVMAHCCLNGPVGVTKLTQFPGGLSGSISTLFPYSGKISNRNWRLLCKPFAVEVKQKFPEVVAGCQQVIVNGDVWPLWEKTNDKE
jgi:hypothetical protein